MGIIKILLITLLGAVALGAIIGVFIGKQSVKRALEGNKSILSLRERIIYGGMMLAGIACILIGVFVVGGSSDNQDEMAGLDMGTDFNMIGEGFDEETFNGDEDLLDESDGLQDLDYIDGEQQESNDIAAEDTEGETNSNLDTQQPSSSSNTSNQDTNMEVYSTGEGAVVVVG